MTTAERRKLAKAALNVLALYAGPASIPPMNASTVRRSHDQLAKLGLIDLVGGKWTVTDAGRAALAGQP